MGVTGIFLYFFLLVHLVGNLGMLSGPEHFNQYGYLLLHTLKEIILPMECVMVLALVAHVGSALSLRRENRAARPIAYSGKVGHGNKTLHSVNMMLTGSAILVFVILHISNFRFSVAGMPGMKMVTYSGVEMHDLYGNMLFAFSQWWYAASYIAVFVLIASHLAHGVQSSLQTLGFNHPKYTPCVKLAGKAYAVVIAGGFSFLAIWGFLQHGGTL